MPGPRLPVPHAAPRRALALLVGVALALSAAGADATDYAVELVVFVHSGAASAPASAAEQELHAPELSDVVNVDGEARPEGFEPLSSEAMQLGDVESRLHRSPRYEVLTHMAWRQPGSSEQAARAVHVHAGSEYPVRPPRPSAPPDQASPANAAAPAGAPRSAQRLDGSVRLAVGRFLHFYTDLVLREPAGGEGGGLREFRLQAHRRMRDGELNYIDHRRLGVLVQVTPIETDNASDAESGSGSAEAGEP